MITFTVPMEFYNRSEAMEFAEKAHIHISTNGGHLNAFTSYFNTPLVYDNESEALNDLRLFNEVSDQQIIMYQDPEDKKYKITTLLEYKELQKLLQSNGQKTIN